MNTPTPTSIADVINSVQAATPDLGLVMLAGFALLLVGFSLLMFRQARQMTHVLPTPLSPVVQTVVVSYVVLTIIVFSLIVANIV